MRRKSIEKPAGVYLYVCSNSNFWGLCLFVEVSLYWCKSFWGLVVGLLSRLYVSWRVGYTLYMLESIGGRHFVNYVEVCHAKTGPAYNWSTRTTYGCHN